MEELIKGNREIVFRYHDKLFSIAYYNDNRENIFLLVNIIVLSLMSKMLANY